MAKLSASGKKKVPYPYEWDKKKRKLSKIYMRAKLLAGIVNGMIVPIVFLLAFFFLGFSFELNAFLGESVLLVPVFAIIVLLLIDVFQFPLTYYSSFVYEHKYGLSRHSKRSWFRDYLKGNAIEYIFSVPLLTFIFFLMGFSYWWIWAAIVYFFLDIFMGTIWPVLILPLFYKLEPFKNAKLKKKLLGMANKVGSKSIKDILVAKESDKSVKANAMFAGMGKTKKMILFDTLLDEFTEDEVETVIGHELGHYVHKDIPKSIALSTIVLFPMLFVVHLALSSLGMVGNIVGLPIYLAALDLLSLVIMPLENGLSRRWEKQADWFGLEHSRKPEAQISTEKRLHDQALADDDPHPLIEALLYNHPAASKRIEMVEEWKKQKKVK